MEQKAARKLSRIKKAARKLSRNKKVKNIARTKGKLKRKLIPGS